MPKPWEYDWSGGGDPSGLDLLPIVPFFGRQPPPMLGPDGQSAVPPPMPAAGPYPMPAMDPSGMQAVASFLAPAADPTALAGAGPSSAPTGNPFAAPAMAPPQPPATDALAQQSVIPAAGPIADRSTLPPQSSPFAAPSTPDVLSGAARTDGQPLLQPATYDSWGGSAAQAGTLLTPSQADPAPARLMLAQQRATLGHGVPDIIPPAMLVHGTAPTTSARQLAPQSPYQQPQPQPPVPTLLDAQRGLNRQVWYDRVEHIGERSDPRAVSPRGAVGPMQTRTSGAIEGARYLHIPLDRVRLLNDPDYNRMIGRGYLDYLLQRYDGRAVLATAAYNRGPTALDRSIQRLGDPRRGEISDWDFVWRLGVPETRDYVLRVVYGESRQQQEQRRRQEQQQRRRNPPVRH